MRLRVSSRWKAELHLLVQLGNPFHDHRLPRKRFEMDSSRLQNSQRSGRVQVARRLLAGEEGGNKVAGGVSGRVGRDCHLATVDVNVGQTKIVWQRVGKALYAVVTEYQNAMSRTLSDKVKAKFSLLAAITNRFGRCLRSWSIYVRRDPLKTRLEQRIFPENSKV